MHRLYNLNDNDSRFIVSRADFLDIKINRDLELTNTLSRYYRKQIRGTGFYILENGYGMITLYTYSKRRKSVLKSNCYLNQRFDGLAGSDFGSTISTDCLNYREKRIFKREVKRLLKSYRNY